MSFVEPPEKTRARQPARRAAWRPLRRATLWVVPRDAPAAPASRSSRSPDMTASRHRPSGFCAAGNAGEGELNPWITRSRPAAVLDVWVATLTCVIYGGRPSWRSWPGYGGQA